VRRIAAYFDRCPDKLNVDDLKRYFDDLLKTHSWSTIKIDRNGLQFFYQLAHNHHQAMAATLYCRTERYGEMTLGCVPCESETVLFHSCDHRSCPRCQNHDTTLWLERQQQKLLPVDYFMVTFTLPYELRDLVWRNQKERYALVIQW